MQFHQSICLNYETKLYAYTYGFVFEAKKTSSIEQLVLQIHQLLCQGHTTLHLGANHTSELDRSEIDLSPRRSELCERSNAN